MEPRKAQEMKDLPDLKRNQSIKKLSFNHWVEWIFIYESLICFSFFDVLLVAAAFAAAISKKSDFFWKELGEIPLDAACLVKKHLSNFSLNLFREMRAIYFVAKQKDHSGWEKQPNRVY